MARKTVVFSKVYLNSCIIKVPLRIRLELFQEYELFQRIIASIVTLDEDALKNDPERRFMDLGCCEGGVAFKNSGLYFNGDMIIFKSDYVPLKIQHEAYPLIMARTINTFCGEYDNVEGNTIQEKLYNAAEKLLYGKMSINQLKNELNSIERYTYLRMWRNFFDERFKEYNTNGISKWLLKKLTVEVNSVRYVIQEEKDGLINTSVPGYNIDIGAGVPIVKLIQQAAAKYSKMRAFIRVRKVRNGKTVKRLFYEINKGQYAEDEMYNFQTRTWYYSDGTLAGVRPIKYCGD